MLEQKYQQQLKEQADNHQKLYLELSNTNKELDRELKSKNFQSDLKSKQNDSSINLAKKITEVECLNERLRKELDDIKKLNNITLDEMESKSEKDRLVLKQKVSDLETRLRDLEGKKGALQLEYEREKVKWSLDKDHLNAKCIEMQEYADRQEKKYDTIVRENEKLKNEKNLGKRQHSGSRIITNQNLNSSYSLQNNIQSTPSQKDKKEISMYTNPNVKRDYPSNYSTQYYNNTANKEGKNCNSNKELDDLFDDFKSETDSVQGLKTDGNNSVMNTMENLTTTGNTINRDKEHKFSVKKFPKLGEYNIEGMGLGKMAETTSNKSGSSNMLFNKSNLSTLGSLKEKKDSERSERSDRDK